MVDTQSYYRAHVFVCQNKRPDGHERGCCDSKGATRLRNYMKVRAKELGIGLPEVRINTAGCMERCEEGPVMVVYPEAVWYSYADEADIDEILVSHIRDGKIVERLVLANRAALEPA